MEINTRRYRHLINIVKRNAQITVQDPLNYENKNCTNLECVRSGPRIMLLTLREDNATCSPPERKKPAKLFSFYEVK